MSFLRYKCDDVNINFNANCSGAALECGKSTAGRSYSSKSAIGGYFSSLIGFSLLFTVTRYFDSDSDLTRTRI